jgi:hypothetical protein
MVLLEGLDDVGQHTGYLIGVADIIMHPTINCLNQILSTIVYYCFSLTSLLLGTVPLNCTPG